VREIRTLRAMWRALETGLRQFLNGHDEGNLGYKPRRSLRAAAPVLDPTGQRRAQVRRLCRMRHNRRYAESRTMPNRYKEARLAVSWVTKAINRFGIVRSGSEAL
jgi:hypothetical protein